MVEVALNQRGTGIVDIAEEFAGSQECVELLWCLG